MRKALIAAAAALLGCPGLKSYEKATVQFGTSTAAGVAAARGVITDAHETCRMRAWLEAAAGRFQTPGFERGLDPLDRVVDAAPASGAGRTWGQHCAALADYDRAMAAGLTALEAYASALRSAAAGDRVALDTDLTVALATDAQELGAQLGTSAFAQARDLAGPLTALANVVLDLVRTQQVRKAVLAGDPQVTAIFTAMRAYLEAAGQQLGDASDRAREVARTADRVIPLRGEGEAIPRELPGQALALYEFSRLESARLAGLRARAAATGDLLLAMEQAHQQLVKGANATVTDAEVRDFVSGKAREIVKQVQVLRSLN